MAAGALLAAASGSTNAQQPLPPKLSTHALDTYTGKQAAGIRIDQKDRNRALESETSQRCEFPPLHSLSSLITNK